MSHPNSPSPPASDPEVWVNDFTCKLSQLKGHVQNFVLMSKANSITSVDVTYEPKDDKERARIKAVCKDIENALAPKRNRKQLAVNCTVGALGAGLTVVGGKIVISNGLAAVTAAGGLATVGKLSTAAAVAAAGVPVYGWVMAGAGLLLVVVWFCLPKSKKEGIKITVDRRNTTVTLLGSPNIPCALSPPAPFRPKKGKAMLFTNSQFNSSSPLEGVAADEKLLVDFFKSDERKNIWRVDRYPNKTGEEMSERLASAWTADFKGVDCLLVHFASHGERDENQTDFISGTDSKLVNFREVVNAFAMVKSLKNVPKVFIFDACRAEAKARSPIPTNCLVVYSTSPGQFAYEGPRGSDFLTELVPILRRGVKDLVNAIDCVITVMEGRTRQVPQVEGSLQAPLLL